MRDQENFRARKLAEGYSNCTEHCHPEKISGNVSQLKTSYHLLSDGECRIEDAQGYLYYGKNIIWGGPRL